MQNRGIKNIVFGLLNQIITIGFGLILPRMFIMTYGSEVNGLLSSVNQIYVYVALLEAGIGTASLQALYKTIAAEDKDATNRVLAATNIFYRKTGIYYFIAVIGISFLYPLIVKSEISFWTVVLVIFFNGMGGVINYFFQGKFRILLRAEGKTYLLSNLSTVIYILSNFFKIIFIQIGANIVVIQFAYFALNIVQMVFILTYIKKHYQWIDLSVTPNESAIASKNSVMVHQITNLVFGNTDVLILTLLSGLKTVSVYSLYNSFFNMLKSVLYSFLDGIQFALGQTFNSDFNKFKVMQEQFEAIYMTLTFGLYSLLYVFILPFIAEYTRGISDISYVDSLLPFLFTLVFLLQGARGPMQLVIEYAGHFKDTRGQAICEMIINLSVSIVAVIRFGIYGVLIGTIIALLYRANAIIIYVNKTILQRSPWVTYKRWIWNMFIFLLVFLGNMKFPIHSTGYIRIIIEMIPRGILIALMYLVGIFICERNIFYMFVAQIKKVVLKK